MPREQLFDQQPVAILEAGGHVPGVRDLRVGTSLDFVATIATPASGQTARLLLHQLVL